MTDLYITKYILINNNNIIVDGDVAYKGDSKLPFNQFAKNAYRHFNINYPKYFKMDSLCKLGFLSSEILLTESSINQYNKNNAAIILSNSVSTLPTDKKFHDTINQIPSPALFVYTLPNILMGEICIRNNLKGENTFFVNRFFNPELHVQYTKLLFNSSNTEICINGWVNYLDEKNYESILFLIEKIEDQQKYFNFNPQNINHLFRKIKENG